MPDTEASQPAAQRSPLWTWAHRIFMLFFALIVLTALVGFTYESFSRSRDARKYPQRGKSYDIGGYSLNLDCSGVSATGSPTVILDSGLGVPAAGWMLVQPHISRFARVCSFDRAGMGWSQPGPLPRTSMQISKELHALLQKAAVPPPYILVGHSFAGLDIRVFNRLYPSEVAGAVFVDAAHEDQNNLMPPNLKKAMDAETKEPGWFQMTIAMLLNRFGVQRYMAKSDPGLLLFPAEDRGELLFLILKPQATKTAIAELKSIPQSGEEARASGDFGDKPIFVLTAGKQVDLSQLPPGVDKKDMDAFQNAWINDLQLRLVRLSTHSRHIVVPNSDHMIPMEQPLLVAQAVQEVWQSAQSPK